MYVIQASRRASRAAVERIRDAFVELDRVAFKDVDIPADAAYDIVRLGKRQFALAAVDPSIDAVFEPLEADCGD